MYRLYQTERLDSLMAMVAEDPTLKEQSANLLDKRNRNWIPKLEEMMAQESLLYCRGGSPPSWPKWRGGTSEKGWVYRTTR